MEESRNSKEIDMNPSASCGSELLLELERYRLWGTPEELAKRLNPRYPPRRISDFSGEHAFLGNDYPAKIRIGKLEFCSVTSALLAFRCKNPGDVKAFTALSATEAKQLAGKCEIRADWNEVKDKVLKLLIHAKFGSNFTLLAMLLATGNAELDEHTDDNRLGKLLMEVRTELRTA